MRTAPARSTACVYHGCSVQRLLSLFIGLSVLLHGASMKCSTLDDMLLLCMLAAGYPGDLSCCRACSNVTALLGTFPAVPAVRQRHAGGAGWPTARRLPRRALRPPCPIHWPLGRDALCR